MKFRPTPLWLLLRRLARSIEANGIGGAAAHSYQRLFRSLKNHGLSGTFDRAFRRAPAAPPRTFPQQTHPFDVLHGIDTGGYMSGAELATVSLSGLYSTAYLRISPSTFQAAVAELSIRYEDFTFVDLGCGKGLALFLAAQFPFRRLIGVEIADGLCRIARSNVEKNPDWVDRISIANEDATSFIYPEGPLLIFLNDPFLAPVLRRVLRSLQRQLHRSPRPVYLLYASNRHFEVMDSFPLLKQVSDKQYPLSLQDTALDPFQRTAERFTLYATDL